MCTPLSSPMHFLQNGFAFCGGGWLAAAALRIFHQEVAGLLLQGMRGLTAVRSGLWRGSIRESPWQSGSWKARLLFL